MRRAFQWSAIRSASAGIRWPRSRRQVSGCRFSPWWRLPLACQVCCWWICRWWVWWVRRVKFGSVGLGIASVATNLPTLRRIRGGAILSGYHVFDVLRGLGLSVALRNNGLLVTPTNRVTSKASEFVREHKQALVAMLERSVGLPTCQRCQGSFLAVPTFDGFENFECQSCGECSGCRRLMPPLPTFEQVQPLVQTSFLDRRAS